MGQSLLHAPQVVQPWNMSAPRGSSVAKGRGCLCGGGSALQSSRRGPGCAPWGGVEGAPGGGCEPAGGCSAGLPRNRSQGSNSVGSGLRLAALSLRLCTRHLRLLSRRDRVLVASVFCMRFWERRPVKSSAQGLGHSADSVRAAVRTGSGPHCPPRS